MNRVLASAIALCMLCCLTLAKGVMNDSKWKGCDHTVTVTLKAQTSGNYEVTFTDEDGNSNSTEWGTPDPKGGVSDCPKVYVIHSDGSKSYYQIENGIVQTVNDSGEWVDMGKVYTDIIYGPDVDQEGDGTLPIPYI